MLYSRVTVAVGTVTLNCLPFVSLNFQLKYCIKGIFFPAAAFPHLKKLIAYIFLKDVNDVRTKWKDNTFLFPRYMH